MNLKPFVLIIVLAQSYSAASADFQAESAQIRRGYQVFREVCSACHGATGTSKAKLEDLMVYDQAALEQGSPFPIPYETEADSFLANGGAISGDLTNLFLIRRDAVSYTYKILTGYRQPSADFATLPPKLKSFRYYNSAHKNRYIAMPPPLVADGQVTYGDGTLSTIEQMAKDVAAFLWWTTF